VVVAMQTSLQQSVSRPHWAPVGPQMPPLELPELPTPLLDPPGPLLLLVTITHAPEHEDSAHCTYALQFGSSCTPLEVPDWPWAHASNREQQFWTTQSTQAADVVPAWIASAARSAHVGAPAEAAPPTAGPIVAPPLTAGPVAEPPFTAGAGAAPPLTAGPVAEPPFTAGDEGTPPNVESELEVTVP